jgi:hypothetical protein
MVRIQVIELLGLHSRLLACRQRGGFLLALDMQAAAQLIGPPMPAGEEDRGDQAGLRVRIAKVEFFQRVLDMGSQRVPADGQLLADLRVGVAIGVERHDLPLGRGQPPCLGGLANWLEIRLGIGRVLEPGNTQFAEAGPGKGRAQALDVLGVGLLRHAEVGQHTPGALITANPVEQDREVRRNRQLVDLDRLDERSG